MPVLIEHLKKKVWLLFFAALFFAAVSAIQKSQQVYSARMMQTELSHKQSDIDDLRMENRLLMIERSAFASKAQVQRLVEKEVGMKVPDVDDIEVIEP